MVDFYRNEKGQVGVLVSHGYGAGFSTWNNKELAYDKRVIELWMKHPYADPSFTWEHHEDDAETVYVSQQLELFGYHNVYLGGYCQIELEWVNPGEYFRIVEYDGNESIEILNVNEDYTYVPKE